MATLSNETALFTGQVWGVETSEELGEVPNSIFAIHTTRIEASRCDEGWRRLFTTQCTNGVLGVWTLD